MEGRKKEPLTVQIVKGEDCVQICTQDRPKLIHQASVIGWVHSNMVSRFVSLGGGEGRQEGWVVGLGGGGVA